MIDLSKSFNPVPKPISKGKKTPRPINKIGKKGRASLDAVKEMKKESQRLGITTCEAKLEPCWRNNALSYGHPDKRRFLKPEDLTKGILICIPCHQIIEVWPREKMRNFVNDIISKRPKL